MWTSRLLWRSFAIHSVLWCGFIVLLSMALSGWNRDALRAEVNARLSGVAAAARHSLAPLLASRDRPAMNRRVQLVARQSGTRVTVIAADGTVLADSEEDPRVMQNHSNRADLKIARRAGRGSDVLRSPTLGRWMQYYSLALRDDESLVGFIRVSIDEPSPGAVAWSRQRTLWSCAAAGIAALWLISWFQARSAAGKLQRLSAGAAAMSAGDFDVAIALRTSDEFETLSESLVAARAALARRLAELEGRHATASAVLAGMVEGVLAVDRGYRILLANNACISLFNVQGPVAGRPLLEVVRSVEIEALVTQVMDTAEGSEAEIVIAGPPRRTLHVFAKPLPGAAQAGVVAVLNDITDLRRLERMRRDFVANVSHELKTPLSAIKAYAETLRMGAIHDQEHNVAFVDRIRDEAQRLHELIADILLLARVESGSEVFDRRPVDLYEVAHRCIGQQQAVATARNLDVQAEQGAAAVVWADSDAVHTILSNLLGNAIKYSIEGGRIRVRTDATESFGVIEVEDNGIGIAAEHQERVFERFFRVDRGRSREQGGTGLGLSIVKHLATSLGGSVSLESAEGEGSLFRVRLPLAAAAAETPRADS